MEARTQMYYARRGEAARTHKPASWQRTRCGWVGRRNRCLQPGPFQDWCPLLAIRAYEGYLLWRQDLEQHLIPPCSSARAELAQLLRGR